MPTYSFNAEIALSGNPATPTWFLGDGTEVEGFTVAHNYENSDVKQVQVISPIKDWTALTELTLSSCGIVGALDLTQLEVWESAEINLSLNPLLTAITFPAAVSGTCLALNLSGCNVTGQSFAPLNGVFQVGNCAIDLSDNDLNQAAVDAYLIELDELTESGYEGRTIDVSGTNEAPGEDSAAAITSLEGKGFTVTVTSA
jgi:hypothetical protein